MIDEIIVPGLEKDENQLLNENLQQLGATININTTRRNYLEAKQKVKQMKIAIPAGMEQFEESLELPYKAVKSLATRIKLLGYALPGAEVNDFEIDRIWADNKLGIESKHAHMSALTYGPSFVAALAGEDDEPDAVIRTLSPQNTTALWSKNKRRTTSGVTVVRTDAGFPIELILYLEDVVLTLKYYLGRWHIEETPTLGHCPLHVMAYDSSPEYPYGRSRISQAVMSLTDQAIRASLRMEVSAEFYSAPQRYLLGADESAFVGPNGEKKTAWEAIIGRMLAIGRDENDMLPEVGQFAQMSQAPHESHLRSILGRFSGATNIPINALGIIHDNPASDAAMHTAYMDLNADAESAHDPFGSAWLSAMKDAVVIRGTGDYEDLELLSANFRDPAISTKGAQAAWARDLINAGVLPAEADVTMELIGLDRVTIDRIVEFRRTQKAEMRAQQVIANRQMQLQQGALNVNAGTPQAGTPGAQPGGSGPVNP